MKHLFSFSLLSIFILFSACEKEKATPAISSFSYQVVTGGNGVLPVNISFKNTSTGASGYHWTFEGGEPSSSDKTDPGIILFRTAGAHKVTLRATNADMSDVKEMLIQLDSTISAGFDTSLIAGQYAPVTVRITNKTTGATSWQWTFEGGTPATSDLQDPPDVTFSAAGDHMITLKAFNGQATATISKKLTVMPGLSAGFSIVPSFDDEDYEAPLTATLANTTVSGNSWKWSSTGGTISNADVPNPSIHFASAGTYTITLKAGNGKDEQIVQQVITVKTNTNLRTIKDVKLGIRSAHSSVGSFYSTRLRKTFNAAEPLDTAGKWVDIAFYGLNKNFVYNKFVSPDSSLSYTLPAIPGAMPTVFINSQELCGCGTPITTANFDAMSTDALLQPLAVNTNAMGLHQFSNTVANRVVLFRTADGRKGAIKIKQYVQAETDSYIVCDIKIQKN